MPFCLNSPIIWRPECFPSLQICSCLLSNLFTSWAASTCPAPSALCHVYVDCPLKNQRSHMNLCTYPWDEAISKCEDTTEYNFTWSYGVLLWFLQGIHQQQGWWCPWWAEELLSVHPAMREWKWLRSSVAHSSVFPQPCEGQSISPASQVSCCSGRLLLDRDSDEHPVKPC